MSNKCSGVSFKNIVSIDSIVVYKTVYVNITTNYYSLYIVRLER